MSNSGHSLNSEIPTYEIVKNPQEIEDTQETKESLAVRAQRILVGEEFMDEIYESMCLGASLATIAETRRLPYAKLCAYANHPDRLRKFMNALDMRRRFVIDKLVDEALKICVVDPRVLFKEDGSMIPPNEIPDEIAGAIEAIEVKELYAGKGETKKQVGWIKKVKFSNKLKAIHMLGQEQGIFKDRVEVSADESLGDLIMKSFKKKKEKEKEEDESKKGEDI